MVGGTKKSQKAFPFKNLGCALACQLLGAQAVGRSENPGVAEVICPP